MHANAVEIEVRRSDLLGLSKRQEIRLLTFYEPPRNFSLTDCIFAPYTIGSFYTGLAGINARTEKGN